MADSFSSTLFHRLWCCPHVQLGATAPRSLEARDQRDLAHVLVSTPSSPSAPLVPPGLDLRLYVSGNLEASASRECVCGNPEGTTALPRG